MAITVKINNNYAIACNIMVGFEQLVQPNPYETTFVGNITEEEFGHLYCTLARSGVNFDWRIHW